MPLIIALFLLIGAVALPALAVSLCALANRAIVAPRDRSQLARRFAFALVPVGISMWAAHLLYHFVIGWSAPLAAFDRVFSTSAASIAMTVIPGWLVSSQLLLLGAGLLLTLYVVWRMAGQYASAVRRTLAIATPWALLSLGLYAAGVWILLQPMQMRGMMH
jgi:hypothetical protein